MKAVIRKHLITTIWAVWAICALTLVGTKVWAAETYEIDNSHSQIGFSVKHLAITNVKGDFKKYSGAIDLDEKDLSKSSVKVEIEAGSIDTAEPKRDEHLRGPDFFSATKHPKITFVSNKVEKKRKQWTATGSLTMNGISKEVSIPFTLLGPVTSPWGTSNIGIEGEFTINRKDWGINWNETLDKGGLVVGEEVKVSLNVEAIKKKAATPTESKAPEAKPATESKPPVKK